MSELTNDKLLQSIKEYFNEYFDEQEKKLDVINSSLDELAAHIIIYTEENKKLFKYLQDLARLNGWKLPEKNEPPSVK